MPYIELTPELSLRAVEPRDHERLAAWVRADPYHCDTTPPGFFSDAGSNHECYVLEDKDGAVFFLKLTRVARLDVQFAPGQDMRERTRKGLHAGFPALAALLAPRGFAEVIFQTDNEELARSMEKRMKFRPSPGEMVRTLGRR